MTGASQTQTCRWLALLVPNISAPFGLEFLQEKIPVQIVTFWQKFKELHLGI
jgi:hypothetical protein